MAIIASKKWVENVNNVCATNTDLQELAQAIELTICIRLRAKPEVGLDEDFNIIMALGEGNITIKLGDNATSEEAILIVSMDYETGKAMLMGKKDMVQTYMAGGMKIAKGNMMELANYSGYLNQITSGMSAFMAGTQWPDELSGTDLDNFKESLKEAMA
jgi:putative sterol carrier protein